MTTREMRSESYDDVPLSALLRSAGSTYSRSVERALVKVGCDDLPLSGSYLITAMHWSGASLEAVIRWMGVTKQAVGQTVDLLVVRGYLERSHDPADRRRVTLTLTPRGAGAAKAARSAIERVDRELQRRVGAVKVAHARGTLVTLMQIGAGGPVAQALDSP
jgi:DNA-binding MarR family transcriptional regulator